MNTSAYGKAIGAVFICLIVLLVLAQNKDKWTNGPKAEAQPESEFIEMTYPLTREWSREFVFMDDSAIRNFANRSSGARFQIKATDPNVGFFLIYNNEKRPEYVPPRKDWVKLGYSTKFEGVKYSVRWALEKEASVEKSEITISVFPPSH